MSPVRDERTALSSLAGLCPLPDREPSHEWLGYVQRVSITTTRPSCPIIALPLITVRVKTTPMLSPAIRPFTPARFIISACLTVALCSCSVTSKPTALRETRLEKSIEIGPPIYFELPPVPRGCVARVYAMNPKAFPEAKGKQTDVADWFRQRGMVFPKGGFAIFLPESSVAILASTPFW